jgi:mitochondrial fission protein ELM1
MAFLELRSSLKFLNPPDARRAACVREKPDCIVLAPREGVTRSPAAPVRIFLGTEPGQYRAERVFVWSIEQARDPARVYEIYLMKDLVGFDRRGWTTGFTNYRFAVPHLAGGKGRAIFNDVDEAYTGDPGELFDLDMGGHGYLATSDSETSVMLIDCERMAPLWALESAQRKMKKQILAATLEIRGIRGDLPPEWTARDEEFQEGRSKLQHWTTLQTQPWRPVPGRFVYQPNPTGELWFDMKRAADAEGYQVFTAERTSAAYKSLIERLRAAPRAARRERPGEADEGLRALVARSGARTLLEFALVGASEEASSPLEAGVTRFDLASPPSPEELPARFDGVVCAELLEYLPDDDVPWVVDALFERARMFVHAVVGNSPRTAAQTDGSELSSQPRPASWWYEIFEAASQRHPELYWVLELDARDARGRTTRQQRDGGRLLGRAPTVWMLSDEQRENTTQAMALTDSLGWPCQRKDLRFTALARLPAVVSGASRRGLDRASRAVIRPPWPDVVVAAGPRTAPVARWIREQTLGRTRLVQLGREGTEVADCFDAVVSPAYARLWPHPRRIETTALLTRAMPKRLARAEDGLRVEVAETPRPLVVLLVDAPKGRRRLSPETARCLGAQVRDVAQAAGGSVVALAGAGTDEAALVALRDGLGASGVVHRRRSGSGPKAGSNLLEHADVVVVPGNDELLLSEAAASGKPVYVAALPQRSPGPVEPLRKWVSRRAHSRPANRRGTARPQQGLEYLCARLIDRGIVSPPLDLGELHRELYRRRIALPLGVPLETGPRPALSEADPVALRVRILLGYTGVDERSEPSVA